MRERRKEPREGSEIDPETACIQKVGAQLEVLSPVRGSFVASRAARRECGNKRPFRRGVICSEPIVLARQDARSVRGLACGLKGSTSEAREPFKLGDGVPFV